MINSDSIRTTADNRYSVYDFIVTLGFNAEKRNSTTGEFGSPVWSQIINQYGDEIAPHVSNEIFEGDDNQKTPALDFDGIQRFAMLVPGDFGADYRSHLLAVNKSKPNQDQSIISRISRYIKGMPRSFVLELPRLKG